MNSIKYVGLDVHRDTISAAVLNAEGKLVMQSVIATHAAARLLLEAYTFRTPCPQIRRWAYLREVLT
jgi:hypothetical protein